MKETWTMLQRNISWVLLLRWCGGPERFTGCVSTVPYTVPVKPRTPSGHLGFVCVGHRKVTSWWFISQGILSTALIKLLNLSCRPIPAQAKICSWQWTQICCYAAVSSTDHVAKMINPEREGSKPPVTRSVASRLPDIRVIFNMCYSAYEVCVYVNNYKSRVELWHS